MRPEWLTWLSVSTKTDSTKLDLDPYSGPVLLVILEQSCFMLLHSSCVAIKGRAILLAGAPGSGKSDLALRLMREGAELVADDQTLLRCEEGQLIASPPPSIEGLIEIRHVGLVKMPFLPRASVAFYVDLVSLDAELDRLPEPSFVFLLDQRVQRLRLPAFAASTPAKIHALLTYATVE